MATVHGSSYYHAGAMVLSPEALHDRMQLLGIDAVERGLATR